MSLWNIFTLFEVGDDFILQIIAYVSRIIFLIFNNLSVLGIQGHKVRRDNFLDKNVSDFGLI